MAPAPDAGYTRGFARQSHLRARVRRIKKRRCPIIAGHRAVNGIFEEEIRELARGAHAISARRVSRALAR